MLNLESETGLNRSTDRLNPCRPSISTLQQLHRQV